MNFIKEIIAPILLFMLVCSLFLMFASNSHPFLGISSGVRIKLFFFIVAIIMSIVGYCFKNKQ